MPMCMLKACNETKTINLIYDCPRFPKIKLMHMVAHTFKNSYREPLYSYGSYSLVCTKKYAKAHRHHQTNDVLAYTQVIYFIHFSLLILFDSCIVMIVVMPLASRLVIAADAHIYDDDDDDAFAGYVCFRHSYVDAHVCVLPSLHYAKYEYASCYVLLIDI